MVAHWQNEKDAITEIRDLKERLEAARTDAEKAEREGDLEQRRAAALRHHARARRGDRGEDRSASTSSSPSSRC